MKVNIKQIPPDGAPLPVSAELDLSGLRRWGETPLRQPVRVEGVFRNDNGILSVAYTARYLLEGRCARCLAPARQEGELNISHTLVERVEDEKSDAFILVPDGLLMLDDLVRDDLSLHLDGVLLCRQDCRGLCPICGADHNETSCRCSPQDKSDDRFDVLKAYLSDQNS